MSAPRPDLLAALDGNKAIARYLSALKEAMVCALREPTQDRPLLASDVAVMDYLRMVQGDERRELVRAFYLDSGNRLLREEIAAQGTVDEAPIYVREIVRRAIELGASAIILAHNHPSGDAAPSAADREITCALARASNALGIRLLDHILVSRNEAISLRSLGYL